MEHTCQLIFCRLIRPKMPKGPIFTSGVSIVGATPMYTMGLTVELIGNFALGNGDSSDKVYPDRVNLLTQNQASGRSDLDQRFQHVGVKDVVMAKLHTGVVTADVKGNLSLCGFGSNGRSVSKFSGVT